MQIRIMCYLLQKLYTGSNRQKQNYYFYHQLKREEEEEEEKEDLVIKEKQESISRGVVVTVSDVTNRPKNIEKGWCPQKTLIIEMCHAHFSWSAFRNKRYVRKDMWVGHFFLLIVVLGYDPRKPPLIRQKKEANPYFTVMHSPGLDYNFLSVQWVR